MKKILALVLSLFVVSMTLSIFAVQMGALSSEPPVLEWNRTYGGVVDDVAWSVVQTNDGGYALAGWTESFGAGAEDFWLIKTDSAGNVQWNKTYGGTSTAWFGERAYCLIQTNDGGYAVAGETSSFGAGSRDFWLVKANSNGTIEWSKPYGGTNQEEAYSLIQTNDGGYAIAGRTLSFGVAGYENMWLVKTDSNGTMEWSEAYGGAGIEIAYSVVQTSDGGYAIGGETGPWGNVRDVWFVKTNSNGTMEWNKKYGVGTVDFSFSMVRTTDGGYAMAGHTETPAGGFADVYLVKTDADGNMQWNQTYGGTRDDSAWSIVQTNDGGYALAGGTESYGSGYRDFWLIKTDSAGNAQWNETYGGADTDWAYSVIQTDDGGYALVGWTESSGAGGQDFWLIKLAPTKIPATIDLDPDTLNLKSKGQWITGYIELPGGYDVNNIDATAVVLNDTIPVDPDAPTETGDYDNDGISDLMVKFDRAEVISYILSNPEGRSIRVTLTITGKLYDGTAFQGNDTIRILVPPPNGKGKVFDF
jgi:hypothetical protein